MTHAYTRILTQGADMAARLRRELEAGAGHEHVLIALESLERRLRPIPGRRRGRPRVADPARVLEMHADGLNGAQIARALGVGRSGVYRLLKEEEAGQSRPA